MKLNELRKPDKDNWILEGVTNIVITNNQRINQVCPYVEGTAEIHGQYVNVFDGDKAKTLDVCSFIYGKDDTPCVNYGHNENDCFSTIEKAKIKQEIKEQVDRLMGWYNE